MSTLEITYSIIWRMPNGRIKSALSDTDQGYEAVQQAVREDYPGANPILVLLQGGKP